MSAKAPIYLKRGSRRGKREKLRDVLSSDMISPPLGDFRHTIHIGSGGGEDDLFGDLSFLQGKFHLLPGQLGDGQQGEPFQFTRTGSVCGPPPSSEGSPLLKNAISLPVIGGVQALTLPASAQAPPPTICQAPPPKPPRLHLEDRALPPAQIPSPPGALTLPSSRASPEPAPALLSPEDTPDKPYLSHAGSLLSLHLDLGPSILDDVLQIMDKHSVGSMNSSCVRGSRHEIFT